jgi:hypothetical protein
VIVQADGEDIGDLRIDEVLHETELIFLRF